MATTNAPPVLTLSAGTVTPGAPILLSSIVHYSDPDGDPLSLLAFDDLLAGAGETPPPESAVWIDGAPVRITRVDANGTVHADDVFLSPEQFARAVIMPVSVPHTIILDATDGVLGPDGFPRYSPLFPTMTIMPDGSIIPSGGAVAPPPTPSHATNAAPTITVAAPYAAAAGAALPHGAVAMSQFFSAADPDGDAVTQYRLFAENGNGHFVVNGVTQAAGQNIDISAADLASTVFIGGDGENHLSLRASDGTAWSGWAHWTVQAPINHAPVATVSATPVALAHGAAVNAGTFFSTTDADGDAIATYRLFAENGNGHFVVNGVDQAAGGNIDVSAADLANTTFVGGAGENHLSLRVSDGTSWSSWVHWTVEAPVNHAPVATVSATPVSVGAGAVMNAGDFFSVSDADGDSAATYRLFAENANGHFVVNGVDQAAGRNIDVSAADFANTAFVGGSGENHLSVRVSDGTSWGSWAHWTVQPPPAGAGGTGSTVDHVINPGEVDPNSPVLTLLAANIPHGAAGPVSLAPLLRYSDADHDIMAGFAVKDLTDPNTTPLSVPGGAHSVTADGFLDFFPPQLNEAVINPTATAHDLEVVAWDGHFTANADSAPVIIHVTPDWFLQTG